MSSQDNYFVSLPRSHKQVVKERQKKKKSDFHAEHQTQANQQFGKFLKEKSERLGVISEDGLQIDRRKV